MDDSIINAINELQEIIDFYYNRDTVETVEFIYNKIIDEEIVKATLLESIGLFEENESNINWNYIIENIYFIMDGIESYVSYQKTSLIQIGYEFNEEIIDNNVCYDEDDMLSMDWIQLDSLDDLEIVGIIGNGHYYGDLPSSKKEYEDIKMYY